jgi:sugar lactone lactonase YvrE
MQSQESVRTIAGRALQTGAQDGAAFTARFNDPAALAADSAGNVYVADSRNNCIRRISPNGAVNTVVTAGAAFDTPSGLAISSQGLIVADTGNHVIRRINADGSVTTIAGSVGQSGSEDGVGAAGRFDSPLGLAISTNGIIYVADCGNHLIRAISPEGAVTIVAGSAGAWGSADGLGSAARFNGPIGLALDRVGNLFVSDSNNHTVRKITATGEVTTWAGAPMESGFTDGDRRAARFFQPAELAFDLHDALYVADSMNHAIRKISPDGKVTTVAGFNNKAGATDGENQSARFYNPYGLAFLPSGELVVADAYNQTIRNALPPAELQITFNRGLSVRWNAVIGKTYQLQTAAPELDAWLTINNPITASDHTASVLLPQPTPVGLFRISISPP